MERLDKTVAAFGNIPRSDAVKRIRRGEVTVDGTARTTADPYAKACGVNGWRSMVIDLPATDPEGWQKDKAPVTVGSRSSMTASSVCTCWPSRTAHRISRTSWRFVMPFCR